MTKKMLKALRAKGQFKRNDFRVVTGMELPDGLGRVKAITRTNPRVNGPYSEALFFELKDRRPLIIYGAPDTIGGMMNELKSKPQRFMRTLALEDSKAQEFHADGVTELPRYVKLAKNEERMARLGETLYKHKNSQPERPLTRAEELEALL